MILATLLGTVVGLNPGVCGGTYVIDATAPTGTIDWPGSGADYSPSASVCWRIQGGSSYVHLDWTRLMIEDHALCVATHPCATGMCPYNGGVLCSHDALTVYDSSTSHRICGTDGSLPDWQPTVAGDIVLHFSSNTVIHSTGFALTWRHCAIPGIAFTVNPPQCAHVYHDYFSTPTGTLKYPSSGNYNEGERKCWRILCNGQLSISWLSVSTEPVHGCFWDYVALYDSSGEEKRVCQPPGTIYYHPGDVVIHLHSDLCTGDAGFELSWSCGAWAYPTTPAAGTLAVPSCSMYKSDFMSSGSLTYPASGTYENSQNVCWRIQCATQVHLTYSFIDIGESTDGRCTMDFLLFAMQGSIYSPNFCGTTVPTYQPSVRGDVVIIFTSGNEVPRTGFGLSWTCDSSAEPPSPSAPSVVFQATAVPSSNACFDVTPSPPTPIPSTPSPPTPFPQTASPPTPNPPTPFPPTPSPPTPFPPTSSPPTPFPPTPSPLTLSPPTPSPPTPFPPTPSPLTPFPPTASPPTPAPSTPFPQTASPPTPSPLTLSPLTPFPQTASPPTSVPLTPNPLTPFPPTASPSTPSPPTPFPPTPNPLTPLPSTLAPSTPFPQTASPSTPSPPTPFPQTASPLTPVPLTPNPLTPFPPTPNPLTPLPPTASPSTASPLTLNPPTPIPITPNPPTLSPLTPFPQTASPLTPVPPTSIPLTSSPLIFFPPTASPLTASPPTPIPLTSSPLTLFPSTASPSTGAPLTSIPPTANPPIPSTSSPLTPAPSTSSPLTLPPLVLSTSAPLTPSPLTLTPLSPSPSTQSPPTVSPLTPVPQTPNPTTSSPPTPFPPSPVPQTHSPLTASPSTLVPLTQAPAQIQTPSPTFTSTAVPSTLSPLTFTPVTHAPLTLIPTFSPTLSPPTPSPHTQVPPTGIPLTPTLTPPNSTTSPQTPNPVTSVPPTSSPLTPFPLTGSPLTPFPQTGSPLTPIPLTGSPLTPIPLTGSPLTPFPLTGFPQTGSPLTPFPLTGSPLTPIPLTGSPLTPFPLTGFPQTGSPLAPFPLTGSPLTPIPLTGSPLTPIPLTGSPLTPIPLTGSPLTPIPLTGSPLTPFPLTGSPLTLTPSTPSPLTAAPLLPTAVPSEAPCFCVHGTCMSGLCNCHTNPVLGYWDGVACNDCKQGWWGRTCTKQCEGGACDPCGGHGQCDGGVGGTGSCSCFSDTVRGHWTGRACGVCRDRWGGARCRLRCPDCSGHGACSNGQCLCDKGYENASNCLTCTSGWSIDRSGFCKSECLGGTAVGLPCSGHGQCTNGLCICDSDYWGVDCSGECKCSNAVCDPLTGKCKCKQHYAEPDCIQCEMGYGGSSCQQKCLCSGHGTCDDAGTCTCSSHWTGDHCDLLCPGIHAPCNNHGVCSTVNGKAHCTCDASPDLGFWLGSDCSTCQSNWWGSMCKLTCPGCGTVGACYPIGKCGCAKRPKVTNDYCGDTCSLKCDSCSDPLRLGATCNRVCPGYPIECSGHGNCDAGVRGTGDCWCSYGWAGAACDLQCPVSFGQPCGGPIRGICEASGTCTCLRNWYGVSCDATCHVEQGVVCSGHGECAADTPTCVCGPGWQGPTCDVECPCGKYGLCTVGGGCECIGNFKFHGGTCSACLAGYAGDRCDLLCVNGQTSTGGTRCLCDSYYSGVSCDSKCPESSSGICNSHGTCIHGSQYPASSCKCSLDWYGKTCDVMCVAERCVAQGLQHAQCGVNGECVCQDNAGGHWTGTQCDSCKDQWYACHSKPVNVLSLGGALTATWRVSAAGMVRATPTRVSANVTQVKHPAFSKAHDAVCARMGIWVRYVVNQYNITTQGCNQLEVPPTRIDLHLPIKKPVFMATDEEHSRLYVGFTSSVAEYQTYPWPPREVRSAVVNNAVGVWFSGGTGYILEQRNNTKHEILSFERRVGLIHISKKGEAQLQEHVVNVCAREGLVVTKDCNLWGMRGQSLEVKSSGVMQGCEYASCDGGKVTLCSEAACNEVDPTTGVASAVKISGRVAAVDKGAVLSCGAAAWVYHNGMGFLVSSNGWCAAAALTVDAANAAAYVFIQNEPSRPATVYKVRLGPDGGYYGRLTLNSILTTNAVNHEYVTITALDNSLRVIFSAGDHMGLSAFTLHEVSAIIPPVADNRGGTSLTIVLKGAENMTKFVEPYTCSFLEGGNVSDAEWLRSSMVTCDTKEVLQPSCEGDYVEIGMSSRYAISTESLRRYVPPMLKTVNNRYGLASTPTVITVTGTGFKKVPSAMCVFSDGSEHRLYRDAGIETQAAVVLPCTTTRKCRYAKRESVTAIHVPATVLDTATVLCTQPAIDTSLSVLSHIDVALDGQIYTGGALQYDILLKGAGIEAPDVYRAVVGSTPEPLRVYTVDGGRRSLEGATEGVENCTAEYVWNDTLVVLDVFEIRGGVGVVHDVLVWDILKGMEGGSVHTFEVTFKVAGTPWSDKTTFHIKQGPAKNIVFKVPCNTHPIPGQVFDPVVVGIVDALGNKVGTSGNIAKGTWLEVNGTRVALETITRVVVDGIATFDHMQPSLKSGFDYIFQVTLPNQPAIPPLLSPIVSVSDCIKTLYHIAGDVGCFPCPEGGQCNGSIYIIPQEGWWSPEVGANVFYRCRSDAVCLGGAASAAEEQCAEGSKGALCQGCNEGWARERAVNKPCLKCTSGDTTLAYLVIVGMLLVGCVLICGTLRSYRKNGTLGHRMVVIRTCIIWMQSLGKFYEYNNGFTEPIDSTLFWFSRASLFDVSLYRPFNCLAKTYFPVLEVYMLFPVTATVLATAVYLLLSVLPRKGERAIGELTFKLILGVSMTVSFVSCYPTMLTHYLAYQKCENFGDGHSPLWVDSSIDCTSAEYKVRKVIAAAMAYFTGAVLPIAFIFACKWLRGRDAHHWLMYLTGGFKNRYWYWIVVVLAREAALVAPALYATEWEDRTTQHYLAMYTMEISLVLQYYFMPFDVHLHNIIECASLAVNCVVVNLLLLTYIHDFEGVVKSIMMYVLSILCFGMLLAFLFAMLPDPVRWEVERRVSSLWRGSEMEFKLSVDTVPLATPLDLSLPEIQYDTVQRPVSYRRESCSMVSTASLDTSLSVPNRNSMSLSSPPLFFLDPPNRSRRHSVGNRSRRSTLPPLMFTPPDASLGSPTPSASSQVSQFQI